MATSTTITQALKGISDNLDDLNNSLEDLLINLQRDKLNTADTLKIINRLEETENKEKYYPIQDRIG